MDQILYNLTQHQATEEQKAQGVVDLEPKAASEVRELLTFEDIPSKEEMGSRAKRIASLAVDMNAEAAMIGGAPYFMSSLEVALKEAGIRPLYAFSRRESVDKRQPDGTVVKTAVFRHLGFVEV